MISPTQTENLGKRDWEQGSEYKDQNAGKKLGLIFLIKNQSVSCSSDHNTSLGNYQASEGKSNWVFFRNKLSRASEWFGLRNVGDSGLPWDPQWSSGDSNLRARGAPLGPQSTRACGVATHLLLHLCGHPRLRVPELPQQTKPRSGCIFSKFNWMTHAPFFPFSLINWLDLKTS